MDFKTYDYCRFAHNTWNKKKLNLYLDTLYSKIYTSKYLNFQIEILHAKLQIFILELVKTYEWNSETNLCGPMDKVLDHHANNVGSNPVQGEAFL